MIEAYPLSWPLGWRRAVSRKRASFSKKSMGQYGATRTELSIAAASERVSAELRRMGAREVSISTNVRTNRDGSINSSARAPDDPGVAVYWTVGKSARCMAIDVYTRVADNLGAVAATLDAMRAIERHGGAAILDRAFIGFAALPAPEQPFQVLGVKHDATKTEIEAAHRRLAMEAHPDRGGDHDRMARINAARDQLLEQR